MKVWYLKRLAVISFSVFITFIEFLYRHMLVLCSEKWRDTLSPSLNNFWYYSYIFVSVRFSLTLTVKVLSIGTLLTKVPFKIFNCYTNKAKMKTFSKCILVRKGG